jgi:hypothetical protein
MKTKLMILCIVVAIVFFNINFGGKSNSSNFDFFLANIESLATGESSDNDKIKCYQTISCNNPSGESIWYNKTYCGSCGPVSVTSYRSEFLCTKK